MADVITKWSDFIITDKGLALRQKAIAKGLRPAFVYAEIGEGVPTDPSEIPLMTALVLPSQRVEVKRSLSKAATHYVDVRIDNKDFKTSTIMREIAVYAMLENLGEGDPDDPELEDFYEPIMYGYSYTINGYESVPAGSEFHRIWTIGANVEISRSKEISIVYDGSNVYTTFEDIDTIVEMAQEALNAAQEALSISQSGGDSSITIGLPDGRALAASLHLKLIGGRRQWTPIEVDEEESVPVPGILVLEDGTPVDGKLELGDGSVKELLVVSTK